MTTTNRARAAIAANTAGTDPRQAMTEVGPATLRDKIARMEPAFAAAMPRGAEATQLVRDAQTALNMVPKLGECDANSVLGALMTCAQLGLRPNVPALGHAWLLPFRDNKDGTMKAQLIVGYQGMVELAQRSGRIQSLVARAVQEHDEFDVQYGLEDALVHKPRLFGDTGPAIAYYAVAKFKDGGHAFVVLSRDQVEGFRARSKSKDKGPWVTDFDAMGMKTAVRQLFKWMPKATDLAIAMSADESVRVDLEPAALDRVQPETIDVEPVPRTGLDEVRDNRTTINDVTTPDDLDEADRQAVAEWEASQAPASDPMFQVES